MSDVWGFRDPVSERAATIQSMRFTQPQARFGLLIVDLFELETGVPRVLLKQFTGLASGVLNL